jgi:hypothetical protein
LSSAAFEIDGSLSLESKTIESTTFDFSVSDASVITDDTIWYAKVIKDSLDANSTNSYVEDVKNCIVDSVSFPDSDVFVTNNGFVGFDDASITISFNVTSADFVENDGKYTFAPVCDVLYGFRGSGSATLSVESEDGSIKLTKQVSAPSVSLEPGFKVTFFSASIESESVLDESVGKAIYDLIYSETKAKADELASLSAPTAAGTQAVADYTLRVDGKHACGDADHMSFEPATGYRCEAYMYVLEYSGDHTALAGIKTDFKAKVVAIPGLPADSKAKSLIFAPTIGNPDCFDGLQQRDESDVDCGLYACFKACPAGATCHVPQDCESYACAEGVCLNGGAGRSISAAGVALFAVFMAFMM